ncbi:MAG: acyl-CoA dehydrogenase [Mycobacterium sp.]|nr:acyl-CoA dehydrogenase [Mycobacterium sp.]
MYGLSADDRRIQETARGFVDSVLPLEVEVEMAGGVLSKEVAAEHHARAIELGLYATNMPTSVGGPGCTALQQILVQEQCGRATNGLAWAMHTPPQWWADVATAYQRERWLLPAVRGEKHEAYAITEEFAGSDVSAPDGTATSTSSTASSGTSRRTTSPTICSSRRFLSAGTLRASTCAS